MLLVQRGATSDFRHDCSAAALAILSHRDVSDLPRDALSLVLRVWPCEARILQVDGAGTTVSGAQLDVPRD